MKIKKEAYLKVGAFAPTIILFNCNAFRKISRLVHIVSLINAHINLSYNVQ